MNIGHVYITGQIGGTEKLPDGTEREGYKYLDLVSAVEALENPDEVHVHINSPGGSVDIGKDMSKYLKSLKSFKTFAEEQCASIATVVHQSAKPEDRFIEEDCVYMVHMPLINNFSGNASQLEAAADWLKPIQTEMIGIYTKSTGLSKATLEGLMNQETIIPVEDCVKLGFASEIVAKKKKQYKAVAFMSTPINTEKMKTTPSKAMQALAAVAQALNITIPGVPAVVAVGEAREGSTGKKTGEDGAVMLLLDTDKGQINNSFGGMDMPDIMIGDDVTMTDTGEAAPDDTYTLEDGTQIVVVAGKVSEIIPAGEPDPQAVLIAQHEAARAAWETEKAQLVASIAEKDKEIEQVNAAVALIQTQVNKTMKSNFTPPGGAQNFRQTTQHTTEPTIVTRQEMEEAKAGYKKK